MHVHILIQVAFALCLDHNMCFDGWRLGPQIPQASPGLFSGATGPPCSVFRVRVDTLGSKTLNI